MSLGPQRRTGGKLTLAHTNTPPALFFCIVSSFIKHVRSFKLNPFLSLGTPTTCSPDAARPDPPANNKPAPFTSSLPFLFFFDSSPVRLVVCFWFHLKLNRVGSQSNWQTILSAAGDQNIKSKTWHNSSVSASLDEAVIQV